MRCVVSVKIRFTRLGKPKSPFYRLVVIDSRKPRDSEYLDKVGHFNPLIERESRSHNNFQLDREKIISWLQKGAQPTQVVLDLLKKEKVWDEFVKQRPKRKKFNKRKSHSTPISEMLKRREEKKETEETKKKAVEKKSKLEEKTESEAAPTAQVTQKASSANPEVKEESKVEVSPENNDLVKTEEKEEKI